MAVPQEQAEIARFASCPHAPVKSPVRVGVLMDGLDAPLWARKTVEEIVRAEHLELTLIIVKPVGQRAEPSPAALFRFWNWVDRRLFKSGADAFALRREEYAIETVVANAPRNGDSEYVFSEEDRAKIKAANLDVIIHFGSGAVPAEILSWARYGVWTFSKIGAAEGDYAQFRDLYERNYVSTLAMSALSPGGERDLYRSTFSNHTLSLYRNRNAACWRKSQIFLRCLADLYQNGWPALGLSNARSAGVLQEESKPALPGIAAMTRFLAGWSLRTLQRRLSSLTFSERWFIAYQDKLAAPGPSASLKTIIPPAGWDYADPFLYEHCGRHYIFFEAAISSHPRGEIWFVELDRNGNLSQPERALSRDYHLSYPFVFEWNGQTYLLPESSQNRSVEVYRATEFPRRWELAGVLLANVPAVDTTLFERNGKLWLFTSGIGGEDLKSSELSLFFSDSLFGPWTSHPKNPIICDVRRARPAGRLFYEEGDLIRPAQDCSECYGHAITLNRIEALSETDYREIPVGTILPDWAADLFATHTLNMDSRYEVLDAKSRVARYGFAARKQGPALRWPGTHRLLECAEKDPVPGA